jgi:hypothetical protein
MSRMIDRLIAEIVADDMLTVRKMKKPELLDLAKSLMQDNLRECTDDTIISLYEEQFNTYLNVR